MAQSKSSDSPAQSWAKHPSALRVIDLEAEWMRHMRRGAFADAWRINEAVLASTDRGMPDDPSRPYHERWVWDGRPFAGRDVLVRCYHGLGDTLQFVRFLPVLRAQAWHVTLEVQPALVPLFRDLPGVDRIVPFDVERPLKPASCNFEIMELPFGLRVTPHQTTTPYLTADAAPVPAGTIGLCWEAGGWDSTRCLPEPLIASLITGPAMTLLPQPTSLPVLNPGGAPFDMVATAGLVAGMALVITCDTMIAHLAGALGRPTWLLLKHEADWRWMTGRTDTPWYPTMRLYRQDRPGDWAGVVQAVARDLAAFKAGANRTPEPDGPAPG